MSHSIGKAVRSKDGQQSIARVYSHVNDEQQADYWDYENFQLQWGCVVSDTMLVDLLP